MMEWETGKHMCNKHEMNLQFVFFLNRGKKELKFALSKLDASSAGKLHEIQASLCRVTTQIAKALHSIIKLLKPAYGGNVAVTAWRTTPHQECSKHTQFKLSGINN